MITTPEEVQKVLSNLKSNQAWPMPELVRVSEFSGDTFYRYRHNDKTFSVFTTPGEAGDRSDLHLAREKIRKQMEDFYTNHPCMKDQNDQS